jgi:putative transposase
MGRHAKRRATVIQANYHSVFCPKYRRPVLTGPIVPRIKEIWKEQSDKNKFDVMIAEIMPDHAHLFLEVWPSIPVSEALRKIKGSSGYLIRKEFPEHVRKFYWKGVFWAPGYFLRSVGDITAQTAIRYIQFQQEHHKTGKKSTKELVRETQIKFKTLDNWFKIRILPQFENK